MGGELSLLKTKTPAHTSFYFILYLSQNSKLKIGESCVIVKLKNKDE